jgi:hypothetical protein
MASTIALDLLDFLVLTEVICYTDISSKDFPSSNLASRALSIILMLASSSGEISIAVSGSPGN